ncbi:MAG: TIGR02679 family protein [Pseudonocardia sp.]
MTPDPRLARLLGTDELAWLVHRARRRLERGEPLTGAVTLTEASPAQRDAAARLLGRRPRPGAALTVRWDAVDDVLRRSGVHPDGLASAIVAMTGPIRDRAADADARDRAWQAAFAPLDDAVAARPELAGWAATLRATGLVRRLASTPETAAPLLADLAAVLAALPVEGEPIGRFAERVLGSAHALDDDRPLATLAFGAARVLGDSPDGSGAAWRRQVWAGVGLLRDDLSSTVLTLGLPGDDSTATGQTLGILRTAGQPAVLTLRQLVRDPPIRTLDGTTVSVCENPVVVGVAADRLGPNAAPLVCVSGQPGAAAMRLLHLLAASGAWLRYHGDFDWGGLRIGNVLFGRLPLQPWRFDTATYRAAAVSGTGQELTGLPIEASWDPDLAAAMRDLGRSVEEERMIDDLVTDLGKQLESELGRSW